MSIRKRNEYLEGDESEEELGGSDSEAEEGRGAIGKNANKRRKIDTDSEASFEDDAEDDGKIEATQSLQAKDPSKSTDSRFDFSQFEGEDEVEAEDEEDEDEELGRSDHDRIVSTKLSKSSAAKQADKAQKTVRKSGVVYISRVPPFMKPQTLKHFLEPHARKGLGRIFLTPEDHVAHTKRVKNGGNKKKSYTDGWVEFTSKTEAKIAAETLNGNIIGGKKGNFYHDDLWNIKYLKGFKWQHLTEQIANENAERTARMREEIRRSRKENRAFVEDVERGKMLDGMESKKKAKREKEGGPDVAGDGDGKQSKRSREFKQRKVQLASGGTGRAEKKATAQTSRALSKVF